MDVAMLMYETASSSGREMEGVQDTVVPSGPGEVRSDSSPNVSEVEVEADDEENGSRVTTEESGEEWDSEAEIASVLDGVAVQDEVSASAEDSPEEDQDDSSSAEEEDSVRPRSTRMRKPPENFTYDTPGGNPIMRPVVIHPP